MSPDVEQATERSHLLQAANDRRLSAIQQEGDAHSILLSHVSKEEQAMSETPVGERLPYNDYTTIDWLHDLVKALEALHAPELMLCRSRIPSGFAPSTPRRAYATACSLRLTRVRDGSQLRS